MLLEDKNAVVYGGGGLDRRRRRPAFAREGARVFLAGRTQAPLDAVADGVRADGAGLTRAVDALDARAVDEHADAVAAAGGLDICFNLIAHGDVQGTPMAEMDVEDYLRPVSTAVRTHVPDRPRRRAPHDPPGRRGDPVFGGEGDPPRGYDLGGLQAAFHALEAMRRQLATELGPHGVRVITLRTGGVPESIPEAFAGREAISASSPRRRCSAAPRRSRTSGGAAAFAASDHARTMTGATVNVSCGTLLD